MNRLFTLAITLLMLGILVAPIAAGNHDNRDPDDGPMSKKKCEEMGGVWKNENGEKACYLIQVTDDDGGPATDDSVPMGNFKASVPSEENPDDLTVEVLTQHGNVGAPGTDDTFESDHVPVSDLGDLVLRCVRETPNGKVIEVSPAACEAQRDRQMDDDGR